MFMELWIWEFFCVVYYRLIRPRAVWCVLALQKTRAVKLMKVV